MTQRIYNISSDVTRYETCGGEVGLVRYEIVPIDPGVPGFSAPVASRTMVEAIFVSIDDAPLAEFVVACRPQDSTLAGELTARGIPFRRPSSPAAATVVTFPHTPVTDADAQEVA